MVNDESPGFVIAEVRAEERQECYLCMDAYEYHQVLQTDCGDHWICVGNEGCAGAVFQQALDCEADYPPRCCRGAVLFIDDFDHAIKDEDLVRRYKLKAEEYRTAANFRRKCPDCLAHSPAFHDVHMKWVAGAGRCGRQNISRMSSLPLTSRSPAGLKARVFTCSRMKHGQLRTCWSAYSSGPLLRV